MFGRLIDSFVAHTTQVTAMAFDAAGLLYSADAAGWVAIWDQYGQVKRERVARSAITTLSIGTNHLAFGTARRSVGFISRRLTPPLIPVASHRRGVTLLSLSPDENAILSNSGYGDLMLSVRIGGSEAWHTVSKRDVPRADNVYGLVQWSHERLLEWGLSGTISALRVPTFEPLARFESPAFRCYGAVFYGNGTLAVTFSDDHILRFWCVAPTAELARIPLVCSPPVRLRVGGTGRGLWVASFDQLAYVDLQQLQLTMARPYQGLHAIDSSADGSQLACATRDGHIDIWDVADSFVTKS